MKDGYAEIAAWNSHSDNNRHSFLIQFEGGLYLSGDRGDVISEITHVKETSLRKYNSAQCVKVGQETSKNKILD